MSGTSRIQLIRTAVHLRAHYDAPVARGPPECATLAGAGDQRNQQFPLLRLIYWESRGRQVTRWRL